MWRGGRMPEVPEVGLEPERRAYEGLQCPPEADVLSAPAVVALVDSAHGLPHVGTQDDDAAAEHAHVRLPREPPVARWRADEDRHREDLTEPLNAVMRDRPRRALSDGECHLVERLGGDEAVGVGDDQDLACGSLNSVSDRRALRPLARAAAFDQFPVGVLSLVVGPDIGPGPLSSITAGGEGDEDGDGLSSRARPARCRCG